VTSLSQNVCMLSNVGIMVSQSSQIIGSNLREFIQVILRDHL